MERESGCKHRSENSDYSYICPLGCPVRRSCHQNYVSEAASSQAHSSLHDQMLRCSLVALQTLILCEVWFLSMKKGAVRGKKPGRAGETSSKSIPKVVWNFRDEAGVKFVWVFSVL